MGYADVRRRDKVKKLSAEKSLQRFVRFLYSEEAVIAVDEFSPADISGETLVCGYRVQMNRKAVTSKELRVSARGSLR